MGSSPRRPIHAAECPSRLTPIATLVSAPPNEIAAGAPTANGPVLVAATSPIVSPRVTTSLMAQLPEFVTLATSARARSARASRSAPSSQASATSGLPTPTPTAPAAR